MRFVTHEVIGADGMVRGMFLSRSLATPPRRKRTFPAYAQWRFCRNDSTLPTLQRRGSSKPRNAAATPLQCRSVRRAG